MTTDWEQQRVYRHLETAEHFMRARDRRAHRLTRLQRVARRLLLRELELYRLAGRYPRNRDFRNHSAPYFIDEDGTRCALAHLLEAGGRADLVQKVFERRNHARVSELADEPELLQFLTDAGLSVEEAGRIQPAYCWYLGSDCFCESQITSFAEATVIERSTTMATVKLRVDSVFGPRPGLEVGDEVSLSSNDELGAVVLIGRANSDATSTVLQLPYRLDATGVRCVSPTTNYARQHSVPKDVAYRALSSPSPDACRVVLKEFASGWAEGPCDDVGCGCRLTSSDGLGLPAIGSVAIVLALLRRRQLRRAHAASATTAPSLSEQRRQR